jgi:hypothetical protein
MTIGEIIADRVDTPLAVLPQLQRRWPEYHILNGVWKRVLLQGSSNVRVIFPIPRFKPGEEEKIY